MQQSQTSCQHDGHPETPNSKIQNVQSIGDKESDSRRKDEEVAAADRQWAALKQERDRLQNQRNAAWRTDSELDSRISTLEVEMRKKKGVRASDVCVCVCGGEYQLQYQRNAAWRTDSKLD